ncbi:Uncharacterized protein TCM_029189 [Theobroma cacao]|uniref:Uncharacterized protein n=1 Tax=Theobroma cacao TaxID=3641 RepID=A0A061GD39_THECC|nr:Uncharacterized protein TCM_029189 [Theobroma cacao]
MATALEKTGKEDITQIPLNVQRKLNYRSSDSFPSRLSRKLKVFLVSELSPTQIEEEAHITL